MKQVTIYWPPTTSKELENRIREKFGITAGTTVNGETPAEIKDEDIELLEETARRGFISLRQFKPELKQLMK